mgnify:FL=1|tara:strand:+ start:642 stop:935 length:294 start_codon:yes stop_codon:yes gene_type:complete
MTEIYEIQGWASNEFRNISDSDFEGNIGEAIIKVSYEPHEGHHNNYHFIADEKGLKIEFEMVEDGHKTTAMFDMCYNSMAKMILEQSKNVERTHIGN